MMNSSVMLNHSKKMAEGLLGRTDLDDQARIRDAYERALGRQPSAKEIDQGLSFISRMEQEWSNTALAGAAAVSPQRTPTVREGMPDRTPTVREGMEPAKLNAWQSYCKSLLASNEFIYLN